MKCASKKLYLLLLLTSQFIEATTQQQAINSQPLQNNKPRISKRLSKQQNLVNVELSEIDQDIQLASLQKIIETSKFGSLYGDEILAYLKKKYGDKEVRRHEGVIKESIKGLKYLGNDLYTTQTIFGITAKIAQSVDKLQKTPSAILQALGNRWAQLNLSKPGDQKTNQKPSGYFELDQNDINLFKKNGENGKKGFRNDQTTINAPDENQTNVLNIWFKNLSNQDNKSIHLIEGVPGSGKTAGILVQFIHTFYEHLKSLLKQPGTSTPRMFFSAPNAAGMKALCEDLGYRDGTLGASRSILTIDELKITKLQKDDIIFIDEIYTISLSDFQVIVDNAAQAGAVLILSGDGFQNLPNQSSILGLIENPIYKLNESRRACEKKMAKIPEEYIKDLENPSFNGRISNVLNIFQKSNLINLLKEINLYREIFLEFDKDRDGTMIIASPKDVDDLNDYIAEQISSSVTLRKVNYDSVYADNSMIKQRLLRGGNKIRNLALFDGAKIRFKDDFIISGEKFNKNYSCTVNLGAASNELKINKDGKEYILTNNAPIDFNYALTSIDSQGASVRRALVCLRKGMNLAEIYVAFTRATGKDSRNVCVDPGTRIYASSKDFNDVDSVIYYPWDHLNLDAKERMLALKATAFLKQAINKDSLNSIQSYIKSAGSTLSIKKENNGSKQKQLARNWLYNNAEHLQTILGSDTVKIINNLKSKTKEVNITINEKTKNEFTTVLGALLQ